MVNVSLSFTVMHSSISVAVILVHLYVVLTTAQDADETIVQTVYGQLRGKPIVNVINNHTDYYYLGIPYAQPPIHHLRFKAPVEVEPWSEVKDATNIPNRCLSFRLPYATLQGNEDCLYMNVYTPDLPSRLQDSKLPVMVYIHGGAFHIGSSDYTVLGPDYLLDNGVIYVNMNYRLGVMGFLSIEGTDAYGNYGLKDQIQALRMVKKIIGQFGGDEDNVTLFGQSAGASSVNLLMLSPHSAGLFHKAIAHSGTAANIFSSTHENTQAARTLGKHSECNSANNQQLLDCLTSQSAEALCSAQYSALSRNKETALYPLTFLPSVEPENDFIVIPDEPIKLLKQGKVMDIPFITGVTSLETFGLIDAPKFDTAILLAGLTTLKEQHKNYRYMVPITWNLTFDSEEYQQVAASMKQHYTQTNNIYDYIRLYSDFFFVHPLHEVTSYWIQTKTAPIYNYVFDYEGQYATWKADKGIKEPGIPHGDELSYIYYPRNKQQRLDPDLEEYHVMTNMVKMWTDFAKYSNPTPDNKLGVTWLPVKDQTYYLEICKDLALKENFEKENMEFLDNLREKYAPVVV